MNRAFLSLYFIIVISVIAIGWAIDNLWQAYTPQSQITPYEKQFFILLEDRLANMKESDLVDELSRLRALLKLEFVFYDLDEFAQSSLGEKIINGEIVSIYDEYGQRIAYKKLQDTDRVISIVQPYSDQNDGQLYGFFLIVFYLGIAIVIYFWVWPLSRDLKILERQAGDVGRDGVPDCVRVSPGSSVGHLAAALNRMADRIRELIASHKEMTYAVSHELRTPLARMKFALQMAKDTQDRDKVTRQLVSIKKDVAEMDSLINQLLTYAGFEQEHQSLAFRPGDMEALIKSLVQGGENDQSDLKITVLNNLADKPVYCEWYLMERALANLIQNAKRYAKSNIKIELALAQGCYVVSVEDDGPGVPKSENTRVFNSFVRLRTDTNKQQSGFGLGLAIVKRILKWHNGTAYVAESDLGGAKFVVSWPCAYN